MYASVPCNGKVRLHFWADWWSRLAVMFTLGVDVFRSDSNSDYDQNNHVSLHIPNYYRDFTAIMWSRCPDPQIVSHVV